ncbi:MAG TPA: tetratricopeptide repeat protein, partial [Armatimonadota bacterium]|nr:tetratricopeptide repeat protein [Armatimonadota bacterium]
ALFSRLVRLGESGEYDRTVAFPAHLLADGPLLYLAVCLHRLARFGDAERVYLRLLAQYPDHPSAVANLAALRRQMAATGDRPPRHNPGRKKPGRRK